jgi:peptide/nickel transport system permease protein
MTRIVARRLLQAIPLLLIVSSFTFILVSLIPGSVATALLGDSGTPAEYAALNHRLGLDQPVYVQYWHWLYHAFHGNLGLSLQNNQPVSAILNGRIDVTLTLVIATVVVVTIVGVTAGVVAALSKGVVARIIDGFSWIGLAFPNFWLGLLLVSFFSLTLKLLPPEGFVTFEASPIDWLRSLVLPIVALSAGPLAIVVKQTKNAMLEEINRPYIRTLRSAGIGETSIVLRHALKNAAIPVVTVLGVIFVQLLGGTVIVETIFVLPGLGSLAASAVAAHDLPVVEGVAVYFALVVVGMNLLIDIIYGWLNPKVRVA